MHFRRFQLVGAVLLVLVGYDFLLDQVTRLVVFSKDFLLRHAHKHRFFLLLQRYLVQW